MGLAWTQQFDWTQDRTVLLRQMFDEKIEAAAMGARLGCSKNAVIGKLHRLGLKRGRPVGKPRERKVRAIPFEMRPTSRPRKSRIPLEPLPRAAQAKIACTPVPLLELQPGQCRFEVTDAEKVADYKFCANAVEYEGCSYCPDHIRLVYR